MKPENKIVTKAGIEQRLVYLIFVWINLRNASENRIIFEIICYILEVLTLQLLVKPNTGLVIL